jgi:phosphatidylserine/phosphatidylglycerophosphate/cardiolipin synthase-like enzyme
VPERLIVKLLTQPSDGIKPLVKAIDGAKKSVEIFIFRFDRREIERALENAVNRGVLVHALIANTNRGGENNLRKLEMRLLAAGITVTRTSDKLLRYHGKLMIIDRRELFLFAFNFTYLDIMRSRSFGIITANQQLIQEAVRLFEADSNRKPYTPGLASLAISPLNARKQLSSFIKAAKQELLIYDPKISDSAMIRLLEERAMAGVSIKIIGRLTRKIPAVVTRKLPRMILHTRTIIRDRRHAFIGSQSLRKAELDARREVGILFRDPMVVSRLVNTFEGDWALTPEPKKQQPSPENKAPAARAAKKVAKAVAKDLPPVTEVLKQVVKEVVGEKTDLGLNAKQVEQSVKDAVKQAVKGVVEDAVQEAVEQQQVPAAPK